MAAKENEMRKQGDDSESSSDSECGASPQAMPLALKSKHLSSSKSKVFSDEDTITLLKSLAVFWAGGRNNKWAEFHQFVKDDLSKPDFTRIQVLEKVRSLKNKYKSNWERVPDDPHELVVYELSKPLWEDEMIQESGKRSPKTILSTTMDKQGQKKKRKHERTTKLDEFRYAYPNLYASFDMFGFPKIVMENCLLFGKENAKKLELEWKKLNAQLHLLEQKRLALPTNQQATIHQDNSQQG